MEEILVGECIRHVFSTCRRLLAEVTLRLAIDRAMSVNHTVALQKVMPLLVESTMARTTFDDMLLSPNHSGLWHCVRKSAWSQICSLQSILQRQEAKFSPAIYRCYTLTMLSM